MYDLTVETVHTFAVGRGGWVVHNCGPASPDDLISMMNRRADVDARVASGEELRYLESQGAQGLTRQTEQGFEVLVRPGSTRAQILHEWAHVVRSRAGKPMGGGEDMWINSWLERHASLLGLNHD
jgi:hypothetical protein